MNEGYHVYKRLRLCGFLALLAAPMAPAGPAVNGAALGTLEGTLAFCAAADPQAAAQYQAQRELLVKDMGPKQVAEARRSADYQQAYESVNADLGKTPKEQAVKACRSAVPPQS